MQTGKIGVMGKEVETARIVRPTPMTMMLGTAGARDPRRIKKNPEGGKRDRGKMKGSGRNFGREKRWVAGRNGGGGSEQSVREGECISSDTKQKNLT